MDGDGGESRGQKRIFALSINDGARVPSAEPGCGDPCSGQFHLGRPGPFSSCS